MDSFSVTTTLTLADWRAYQRTALQRLATRPRGPWATVGDVVLWIVIAMASAAAVDFFNLDFSLASLLLGLTFGVVIVNLAQRTTLKAEEPAPDSFFLDSWRFDFDTAGVTSTGRASRTIIRWSHIVELTHSPDYIYIWIDKLAAHVVPVRDLPAGLSAEEAMSRLQALATAHKTPSPEPPSLEFAAATESVSPVVPEHSSPMPETISWTRAAFHWLTLRSIDATPLPPKPWAIVLLFAISTVIWTGLDWFNHTPAPQFYPYDFPMLAWFVVGGALVAGAMARFSSPTVGLSRAALLLGIVAPLYMVVRFMIHTFVPKGMWKGNIWICVLVYLCVYCALGLRSLTGGVQRKALLAGFVATALFLGVSFNTHTIPTFWIESESEEGYEDTWAASEEILFEQSAMIDEALEGISRPAVDAPVGFFVGFAGYGEQKVFAEEIDFAADIFARRYDTASRSLLLVNDDRDLESRPLASTSGLRYGLNALAEKMDLDRDILFLTLSSHGSEDTELSVSNGVVPLSDLSGETLAEILRESKIRWRVIVISACYAGGFIDHLRDPYTIVITAASKDRTSFGCSDDRDLTYFGEAFLRDSLPQAKSVHEAFDHAKQLIEEREKQEDVTPSDPQAYFGKRMETYLSEFETKSAQ